VLCAWKVSQDLFLRVEVALVVSSTVALVSFALSLKALLKSGATVDIESVTTAI
jgi:hypothetical protein